MTLSQLFTVLIKMHSAHMQHNVCFHPHMGYVVVEQVNVWVRSAHEHVRTHTHFLSKHLGMKLSLYPLFSLSHREINIHSLPLFLHSPLLSCEHWGSCSCASVCVWVCFLCVSACEPGHWCSNKSTSCFLPSYLGPTAHVNVQRRRVCALFGLITASRLLALPDATGGDKKICRRRG